MAIQETISVQPAQEQIVVQIRCEACSKSFRYVDELQRHEAYHNEKQSTSSPSLSQAPAETASIGQDVSTRANVKQRGISTYSQDNGQPALPSLETFLQSIPMDPLEEIRRSRVMQLEPLFFDGLRFRRGANPVSYRSAVLDLMPGFVLYRFERAYLWDGSHWNSQDGCILSTTELQLLLHMR